MSISMLERALFRQERIAYHELTSSISATRKGFGGTGAEIVCIGEGAGSHCVTRGIPGGGFLLRVAGRSIIVDPGAHSMALLERCGIDPYEITDVAATHAHNDHVGNLTLAVSAARLLGLADTHDAHIVICPSLADYLHAESTRFGFTLPSFALDQRVIALSTLDRTVSLPNGIDMTAVPSTELPGKIAVRATPTRHGSIEGVGFVFDTPLGRIGYTGDTGYFDELDECFAGCDLLWLNLNTLGLQGLTDTSVDGPVSEEPAENHLGYVGCCRLIEAVRPANAVISHFGAQLLEMTDQIAGAFEERFGDTGTHVRIARRGQTLRFASSLRAAPEAGPPCE